jgi:hypothetical protein
LDTILPSAGRSTTGPSETSNYSSKEKKGMKLSEPKTITFWIAVILGVLGVIAKFTTYSTYAFWLVLIGLIVLVLGNLMKGL